MTDLDPIEVIRAAIGNDLGLYEIQPALDALDQLSALVEAAKEVITKERAGNLDPASDSLDDDWVDGHMQDRSTVRVLSAALQPFITTPEEPG